MITLCKIVAYVTVYAVCGFFMGAFVWFLAVPLLWMGVLTNSALPYAALTGCVMGFGWATLSFIDGGGIASSTGRPCK